MAGEIKKLLFSEGVSVTAPGLLFRQSYFEADAVNWDGVVKTVTYDVSSSVTDATKMLWQFQDNANNNRILTGADIDFPSATQVRVTFGVSIASGTYTIVGSGGA